VLLRKRFDVSSKEDEHNQARWGSGVVTLELVDRIAEGRSRSSQECWRSGALRRITSLMFLPLGVLPGPLYHSSVPTVWMRAWALSAMPLATKKLEAKRVDALTGIAFVNLYTSFCLTCRCMHTRQSEQQLLSYAGER
jgi:hypothetical protein